jgi:hypothetical protein
MSSLQSQPPHPDSVAAALPQLLETLEHTSERFRGEERKFAEFAWVAVQALSKQNYTGNGKKLDNCCDRLPTNRPIATDSSQDFSRLLTSLLNDFAAQGNTTFSEVLAIIHGDAAHDYLRRSRENGTDVTMDMVSYFQRESERGLDWYKRLNEYVSSKLSEGDA